MHPIIEDPIIDAQMQRALAKVEFDTSSIGEILQIASTIDSNDIDSWNLSFFEYGSELQHLAAIAEDSGHYVTARNMYLRASEYFRSAFFFHRSDLEDDRLHTAYEAHRATFRKAIPLLESPVEVLDVEGDGGTWIGYLATPAAGAGPWPTIVLPGGYDSTCEELVYPLLREATARGFAVYAFDGPGQAGVLFQQKVTMRPDWENVLPQVVDALVDRPEVDSDRIVMMGRSFGGYIAPRAASGEKRFAAIVADPALLDVGVSLFPGRLPVDLASSIDEDTPETNNAFDSLVLSDRIRRLVVEPRMTVHGTTTIREYSKEIARYTNEGKAELISCPTLICDNEDDPVFIGPTGADTLYENLTCPKSYREFTIKEGAVGHCEGFNQKAFYSHSLDWLTATLKSTN